MNADTQPAAGDALLPCPFCGHAAPDDLIDTLYPRGRWREDDGIRHYLLPDDKREGHGRVWAMHCSTDAGGCGAQVSGDTRGEAIARWNRRTPQEAASGAVQVQEVALDAAGNPKLPLTVLEALAVDACNLVKAWAESDRRAPFPVEAHMKADGVLMMAAQRRKGVQ